jgi:hypothetical protein
MCILIVLGLILRTAFVLFRISSFRNVQLLLISMVALKEKLLKQHINNYYLKLFFLTEEILKFYIDYQLHIYPTDVKNEPSV